MANSYEKLVNDMRTVFKTGRTRRIEWREQQLRALHKMLCECQEDMADALYKDLHKHKQESFLFEIGFAQGEVAYALNNLDEWTKPEYVKKNYMSGPLDTPIIYREPYGVVLVIGAWNYPIQLILHVLVGVIAAGNCVVLKPSEISENTAELLAKIVPKYMDTECIQVINGDVPVTTALLKERWDYILYTGSSTVGKIVMEAASKHLTPVTLEMGGKSPCIVDASNTNFDVVAKRIIWGKFTNTGQTCIAPDYVMVTGKVKQRLVEALVKQTKEFFGENPQTSDSYGRIGSRRHWFRLKKMLDSQSGTIYGGRSDEGDLYIEPTYLVDVSRDDEIMQNEIFGPILPIMAVSDVDEAISYINDREKPLAMYIFSKDQKAINKIQSSTSSGSICVNDCMMQGSVRTLPFGGVGYSGLGGGYHGRFTYETFSHKKAFLHRTTLDEPLLSVRYPPFSDKKMKMANNLIKVNLKKKGFRRFLPFFIVSTLIAFFVKLLGVGRYLPNSVQNVLKMD